MIQVENEVGVLARRDTRRCEPSLRGPVPKEFMDYLQKHKDTLIPNCASVGSHGLQDLRKLGRSLRRRHGNDELFMAWNYARYIGHVAAAGKADIRCRVCEYLAAPERQGQAGNYPSGGRIPT